MKSHIVRVALLCLAASSPRRRTPPSRRTRTSGSRAGCSVPSSVLKHQSKLKLSEKQRDAIGAELKRVQAQAAESDWTLMSEAAELQELIDKYPVD